MKIFLAKPRGFCAGVVRAIKIVERALELWDPPIYVQHEIVHNRHVVNKLKDKGIVFVESIEEIPIGGKVVYSAHGVSPKIREEAKKRGLLQIDATCALVTKGHSIVRLYAKKGYKIILIGHKNHVEIIGTQGEAPFAVTVVEKKEDVEDIKCTMSEKLIYLTQTTLNIDDVTEIIDALLKRYPHIKSVSSSICYATANRQLALKKILNLVDLVLVVGDPRSSNSNRLREIAQRRGKVAYLVNGADEIDTRWMEKVENVAMTAGASTPEEVVQECIERLTELGVTEVEELGFKEEDIVFQLPSYLQEG